MLIKVSDHSIDNLNIFESFISDIWNYDIVNNKYLYDGEIFCINKLDVNEIIGYFASYRYTYVQSKIGYLGIRTLAVVAAVKCLDGFILVKRSQQVTQDKGLWELSISGGIEKFSSVDGLVDPEIQIKKEIFEELGIDSKNISSICYLGYLEDSSISHVVDLVYQVDINLKANDIKKIYDISKNNESTKILVCQIHNLKQFFAKKSHNISPASIRILNLFY